MKKSKYSTKVSDDSLTFTNEVDRTMVVDKPDKEDEMEFTIANNLTGISFFVTKEQAEILGRFIHKHYPANKPKGSYDNGQGGFILDA